MTFIVTLANPDGTYDEVGMRNRFLTSHYKTITTLIKWGIPRHWKKSGNKVRIEHYSGSVYGNPSATSYVVIDGCVGASYSWL